MADKKGNDNLFQWNFNLEDSDSDFTDIDFSTAGSKKTASSDKDIQPIIFVRDETAKKKTEEKRTQTRTEELVSAAENKRSQSSQKKPAQRKPAAKKKKKSSGPELNWKLIAVIAAAVLLVAALVVLFTRCGKKEDKAWTAVEADSKIQELMNEYFYAKRDGDATRMRKVLVADTRVNASVLGLEAQIYKDYTNVKLQQYPGINKNETVICAAYDTVLSMIDASVPTIGWFYALPDDTNNLRLMTISELEQESNKTYYNYVLAAYKLLEQTTVKEVADRHAAAVNSNPQLAQYLENIKNGRYFDIPDADVTPQSSEDPANPVDPSQSSEADPAQTSTEEPGGPTVLQKVMYVNASLLNMRSTPTTAEGDTNIIWKFTKGYCVTVISEENGWYKIKDDVKTNPASNAEQPATYAEGYVSKDYLVSEYSQIQW